MVNIPKALRLEFKIHKNVKQLAALQVVICPFCVPPCEGKHFAAGGDSNKLWLREAGDETTVDEDVE